MIMARQEALVINNDGEEMLITQIVEEPGSQEIHAGATPVPHAPKVLTPHLETKWDILSLAASSVARGYIVLF